MLLKNLAFSVAIATLALFWACTERINVEPNSSSSDDSSEQTVEDDGGVEENVTPDEDEDDYVWDGTEVLEINLEGDAISADDVGVTIDGTTATITHSATYVITGTLNDGEIIVDAEDDGDVRLLLSGVNIHSDESAPIFIKNAEKAIIILDTGTVNYLSDADVYVLEDPEEDEPNAAIFSKENLVIYGEGTLNVTANYNDAITSKDGLIIKNGTYIVSSVDDGIRGKDYLLIHGGDFTLNVDGDALKSDEESEGYGYITIEDGTYRIDAGADGLQAESNILIYSGDFDITTGGGSNASLASDASAKGLKASFDIEIDGGQFVINAADDAIHANEDIVIDGGVFALATGDDGVHSDETLTINAGEITVTDSYEGLESAIITINDGDISVVTSDDGINVAGGNDGSGGGPGGGGQWGGGSSSSGDYYLYINGGYIVVDADGDGLDANGSIVMTGGTVLVHGPTSSGNGALDYDGSFKQSGGFLIAAGSSGMMQAPSSSSTQNAVAVKFSSSQSAGNLVNVQSEDGTEIFTFSPAKKYQSIVFSNPELTTGTSYVLYQGGSDSKTEEGGLYGLGGYSGGTQYTTFTISSTVTSVGR